MRRERPVASRFGSAAKFAASTYFQWRGTGTYDAPRAQHLEQIAAYSTTQSLADHWEKVR